MLFDRLRHYCGLHVVRITCRPLTNLAGPAWQKKTPITYRLLADRRQLLPHCADPNLKLSPNFVREALARGDLCVAAFDCGRLVAYYWMAFGPTPHIDGVWVDCDKTAIYGYKQFVLSQYRGKRIAAALATYGDSWFKRRGRSHAVSFIDLDNQASWHASLRAGSRALGYAGYLKIFGMFLSFRTAGARKIGFRFHGPTEQIVPAFRASLEMDRPAS
jgi:hypothetical protein